VTLIPADAHLAVMAGLFAISGGAFLLERTRWGAQLSGAVLAILGAIAAANLGLLPHSAPAYDFVFTFLVPVLIPLFLFQANLKRIFSEAARLTLAFGVASLGTVLGVVVALSLLDASSLAASSGIPESQREAAIAGLFASTYIGGSVNYAALGDVTGLNRDASFFSAATAADNLFSAVYLAVLALLPGWAWLARRFVRHREREVDGGLQPREEPPVSAMSLCLALATSLLLVALTDALVAWLGLPGLRYVLLSALTLLLATAVDDLPRRLAGAFELGVCLSFVFFAAIAAGADVPAMLGVAPLLVALVLILLSLHLLLLLVFGSLLRLSLPELIIASNAAVLGATTAPALAATKGWRDLVTPGVLVGVLGYALGTFVGTALYRLWGGAA
jgi:uncharacterized membrane protein